MPGAAVAEDSRGSDDSRTYEDEHTENKHLAPLVHAAVRWDPRNVAKCGARWVGYECP